MALRKALSKHEAEICRVAGFLAERGWAEANGGNLSIRLETSFDPIGERFPLSIPRPELEGHSLLLTTTGSRMRDLAENPLENLCLVRIVDSGSSFLAESEGGEVTSEFPTHLAVHALLVMERPDHHALLHTHPTFLIALTHLVKDKAELRDTLIRMFPEAALLLHDNLEVLDYVAPGSDELGAATVEAIRRVCGVIWRWHGMVATGANLSCALDLVEVAEKAARIALLLGDSSKECGLSDDQLKGIYEAFGD
ncbi:MAG: rhamnulose-1-phosphate aldolase [Candidatus Stahlbacteria bacterium]|nr:MAG: rhamnulose-1-phosphate aldolase [Candidatus Stahlbacteria bacterium]